MVVLLLNKKYTEHERTKMEDVKKQWFPTAFLNIQAGSQIENNEILLLKKIKTYSSLSEVQFLKKHIAMWHFLQTKPK